MLTSLICASSYGEVYLVQQSSSKEQYAIKCFKKEQEKGYTATLDAEVAFASKSNILACVLWNKLFLVMITNMLSWITLKERLCSTN